MVMGSQLWDVLRGLGLLGRLLIILVWIPFYWFLVPFLIVMWLDIEVESLTTMLLVGAGAVIGVLGASAMLRSFTGDTES